MSLKYIEKLNISNLEILNFDNMTYLHFCIFFLYKYIPLVILHIKDQNKYITRYFIFNIKIYCFKNNVKDNLHKDIQNL